MQDVSTPQEREARLQRALDKEREQSLILERRLNRAETCIKAINAAYVATETWDAFGPLVRNALADYDEEITDA